MIYYRYPVEKIGITSDYGYRNGILHAGLDLGWFDYQGENIYSIGSGEVVEKGFTSSQGNYVVIKHNDRDTSRYMHLKSSSVVNIGDIVSMGTLLGYMGTTGNSNGVHLHIEIKRDNEYIDPKSILYVYNDQIVGENTKASYTLLYYDPPLVSPVVIDEELDQIIINASDLIIRKGPGTSFNKYTEFAKQNAIYNYYEVLENEGYLWYKIGEEAYVALVDNSLTVLDKKEENDNIENYKFEYTALETGNYKIKLNKGEKLIIL